MFLEILTPDKKVFEGEINSINLLGSQGRFEILPKHAAIISTLEKGSVKVVAQGGLNSEFTIDSGVVEVLNDRVVLLAEAVL